MKLIGSDIDGVCADFVTPFLRYLSLRTGLEYSLKDVDHWNMWEALDKVTEQMVDQEHDRFVRHGCFKKLKSIAPTRMAYRKMSSEGYEFIYVSVRPPEILEDTMNWLHEHGFPNPENVMFHADKAGIAKRFGLHHFVEDSYQNAKVLAKSGVRVFLLDRPWNKAPVGGLITRVKQGMNINDYVGVN